jgi:hypothetical protein
MKRFLRILQVLAVVALGSVLTLSCILDSGDSSGSVMFTIQGKGAGETARVYLVTTDGVLASIGGGEDYVEVGLGGTETTVTIDGLPAGAEYNAFFGLGDNALGHFRAQYYAVSDEFAISAGTNVDVDLGTLDTSLFTHSPQMIGKNVKGVVVSGGTIYAPTSNRLYNGGTVDAMNTSYALPGGHTANSISLVEAAVSIGVGDLWINTNKGIVPTDGSGAYTTDLTVNLGNVSILNSGAYEDIGDEYIFYQRDGGLGGVEDTGNFYTYDWKDIDLSDQMAGQPVHDFVDDGSQYGYFATRFGAFRLPDSVLDGPGEDLLESAGFFHVGDYIPVIAIDYNGGDFILGSEDGVWITNGTNPYDNPPSAPVTGTAGERFHMVAIVDQSNWAAMSDFYLYIMEGGALKGPYPFVALPGEITGMAYDGTAVVISGDEGLASIDPP